MTLIKSVSLPDPDARQTLLILPCEFVKLHPDDYVVEYADETATVIRLRLVDPKSPAGNIRYKVIRHHYATHVSVPRPWIRDQGIQPGLAYVLDVYADAQQSDSLFLSVREAA